MFEALDQALLSGDNSGAVSEVIDRIVELAKTNPLDRFRNIENVKGFLHDPDSEIQRSGSDTSEPMFFMKKTGKQNSVGQRKGMAWLVGLPYEIV